MKDIISSSFVAGATAFLYKNILNHILFYLGITSFLYRVEAATVILPIGSANTLYGILVGLFADLIVVCWFALAIAVLFKLTGRDYALLKGAFVGASSWVIVYSVFVDSGILGLYPPKGIDSVLTTMFFDTTMGIVSAYVLVVLNKKKIDA